MTGGTFPKSAKLSSHHAPRKRGWSWLGALFMLVTAAALVARGGGIRSIFSVEG